MGQLYTSEFHEPTGAYRIGFNRKVDTAICKVLRADSDIVNLEDIPFINGNLHQLILEQVFKGTPDSTVTI